MMYCFDTSLLSLARGPSLVWATMVSVVVLIGFGGCGSQPTGSVSGKVTVGAAPLTDADVLLCRSDGGAVAKASLGSSGEFKFDRPVPTGEYLVQIESTVQEAPPASEESRPAPKQRFPEKYQSSRTSGLKADVKPGDNRLNFSLE